YNPSNKDIYVENNGKIEFGGENNIAIKAIRDTSTGKSVAVNNGDISINGIDSVGMYADNSTIENNGKIHLNIFKEGTKVLANNKAMVGKNESIVTNSGSIYLSDVEANNLTELEMKNLTSYVNNTLISTDESTNVNNTGVIRNNTGEVIAAAGGDLTDVIPGITVNPDGNYELTDDLIASLDKVEVVTTDKTIQFTGDKLNININANEKLDKDSPLVLIKSNEKVDITANLIGADNGLVVNDSTVNISNSNISVNTENKNSVALKFENDSKGNISGTSIIGAIQLDGSELDIKESKITGNISLKDDSKLTINATSILGNIYLNNSSLELDTATSKGFAGVIDGSSSKRDDNGSTLVLGDKLSDGKASITNFNGTIKDVENVKTNGILVMGDKSNFINSSIDVKDENLLVIRVGEGEKDYALSDNVGTLNLAENGHLMIETGRAGLKDGSVIELTTTILGDSSNIHASEYIYNISILDSEMKVKEEPEGTKLVVSLKSAKEVGIDSEVTDVYNSLASSGRLGELVSVNAGNDKKELNSLLKQNSHENPYSLGDKVSRDSIGVWNDAVKNNINFLETGEFKISGLATGTFETSDTNLDYDFSGAGLMVLGQYGYNSKTTLGFSAAGGSVSGEINSDNKVSGDSFYFSVFGQKAIDEILLTANIGYQLNNLEGKRKVGNIYENYNFNEDFNTNGFNVDLEGRYIYAIQNDFTLEPHFGVNVVTVNQDSISEDKEDGVLAMKLNSSERTTVKTKLGLELAKNIALDGGSKIKLFGDLSYVNNSGDVDKEFTGKFIDSKSDFGVKAVQIGKNKGEVSIGGKFILPSGVFSDMKLTQSFGDSEYTKVTASLGYTF
ncbi:MAG: autotransporter outer membrane beta-barrel domain-containing protein, partial [Fusobacteriaceae bacterium]